MSDTVPPHDPEAESAVIAAIFGYADAFDRTQPGLKAADFYDLTKRLIFGAAEVLAARGAEINVVSVSGVLRDGGTLEQVGGSAALVALFDTSPACVYPEAMAGRVAAKARLRRYLAALKAVTASGYEAGNDVGAYIDTAEATLYAASETTVAEPTQSTAAESASKFIGQLTGPASEASGGVSTGFAGLDNLIGGLYPGDVTVVAARPGMGKTAFASAILSAFVSYDSPEHGALFCSMEMPSQKIIRRFVASEARISTKDIAQRNVPRSAMPMVIEAAARIGKWPLVIDDAPALTLASLRSSIRRATRTLERKYGRKLGLVVIDYLQLMKAPEKPDRANRTEVVGYLSGGIREIAKQHKTRIVLLSQLSRKCEERPNKRPLLSDLRDSGEIEQDAQAVVFLYREDEYSPKDQPKTGNAELIVAKCRDGETGTVEAEFDGRCARFFEREQDPIYAWQPAAAPALPSWIDAGGAP